VNKEDYDSSQDVRDFVGVHNDDFSGMYADTDLPPPSRTKVMEQSPLISENSGYETIQIYR
jgi:hypothetical protein